MKTCVTYQRPLFVNNSNNNHYFTITQQTRKRFSEKPIVAFTNTTVFTFILDFYISIRLSLFGLMFLALSASTLKIAHVINYWEAQTIPYTTVYSDLVFLDRFLFELSCKNTHTHKHTHTHTHRDSNEYPIVAFSKKRNYN